MAWLLLFQALSLSPAFVIALFKNRERYGLELSRDSRGLAMAFIVQLFPDSRKEDIGLLVAGRLLAVFLASIEASLYNKAVDRALKHMRAHF